MNAETRKRGLGRGLDALFKDGKSEEQRYTAPAEETTPQIRRAEEIELAVKHAQPAQKSVETKSTPPAETNSRLPSAAGDPVRTVGIEKLKAGKFQPRRTFSDESIEELADSLSSFGILQPLIVRPAPGFPPGGMYEIIGGERRWRAAQKARIHDIPVVIRDYDDKTALEVALVENLQREDLNPIDEADGYQRLMEEFDHTQEMISHQLGKSRSHIANMLRLLKLPAIVRKSIQNGELSTGHARALIGVANAADIVTEVLAKGLNVRQTERLIRDQAAEAKAGGGAVKKDSGFATKDVDVLALERKISGALGLKVSIEGQGPQGKLVIAYKTLEQLDDLLARLARSPQA